MGIFLGIAYIFCLCMFSFLGIAWILDGNTSQGMTYLGIVVVMIVPVVFMFFRIKNKGSKNKNWTEKQIEKYSLRNNKFVLYGSSRSNYLVYTCKSNLVFINQHLNKVSQIKLEDILDIKVEIIEKVKNQRRIIALVPTYDKNINIEGIKLSIVTRVDTYSVEYTKNDWIFIDTNLLPKSRNTSMKDRIEEFERYRLIIEQDMKNLKGENI